MGLFRVPNFVPGFSAGRQIVNLQSGGPSGGHAGYPIEPLSRVPRTGPNGNMQSMNGSGGGISGFLGFHWQGPANYVGPGPAPYGNEYAFANQTMFIPGMIKNPLAPS